MTPARFGALDTWRVTPGTGVVGTKLIRADDPYQSGHYPGCPIYPGVFVVESACAAVRRFDDRYPVLAAIDSVRFSRPLRPGDTLRVDARCQVDDRVLTARVRCVDGADRPVARMTLRLRPPGFAAPAGRPGAAGAAATGPGPDPAELLPHRAPILLVDRVLTGAAPGTVVTARTVDRAEPCYAGLGGTGAYPPTLLLESFAQSCGIAWRLGGPADGTRPDGLLLFGAARAVAFHRPVYPGDTIRHEVRLDHASGDSALLSGASYVDGIRVATVGSALAVLRTGAALGSPTPAGMVATRPTE